MGGFAPHFSNQNFITAQLQIEELTRKLRTGDLGISANAEDRCGSTTASHVVADY